MITTVDGVIKKAGDTAWAISLNHDRIYESIQVIISDADSLAKCLYFDERGLCSEQVGLMNQEQCNLMNQDLSK